MKGDDEREGNEAIFAANLKKRAQELSDAALERAHKYGVNGVSVTSTSAKKGVRATVVVLVSEDHADADA